MNHRQAASIAAVSPKDEGGRSFSKAIAMTQMARSDLSKGKNRTSSPGGG